MRQRPLHRKEYEAQRLASTPPKPYRAGAVTRYREGGMRVRLDLDPEATAKLIEIAVAQRRPLDWTVEVILLRALGLWREDATGEGVAVDRLPPAPGHADDP